MAKLSKQAINFLKDVRFAVLCTLNQDGSPHLSNMWYLLEEDNSLIMNTQTKLVKARNIAHDSRIAVCIEEGTRYVSINGIVEVITNPTSIDTHIQHLLARYIQNDAQREAYYTTFSDQKRISLRLRTEKIHEFFS